MERALWRLWLALRGRAVGMRRLGAAAVDNAISGCVQVSRACCTYAFLVSMLVLDMLRTCITMIPYDTTFSPIANALEH